MGQNKNEIYKFFGKMDFYTAYQHCNAVHGNLPVPESGLVVNAKSNFFLRIVMIRF